MPSKTIQTENKHDSEKFPIYDMPDAYIPDLMFLNADHQKWNDHSWRSSVSG